MLVAAAVAASVAYAVVSGVAWFGASRTGAGRRIPVEWPSETKLGVERLVSAGIVDRPLLFRLVLAVTSPLVSPAEGEHLLADDLSPAEVLRRLARLSSRARVKLLVPEGVHRFQIGERLEELGVCSAEAFARAATDRAVLEPLGVPGASAEGYLFPATYELFADAEARAVVKMLVSEAKQRLLAVRERHAAGFARLAERHGWGEPQVLTLASVVEKEAARGEERPLIASVFMNRLENATFKPAQVLQSDPTAAYGCLVMPELASCQGYSGRVLPAMLRDAQNPYNTYRHPGLPPGPIGNPGAAAIEAVLAPAQTDYLFFVAAGDGRHTFSRTLEEHEKAIRR